MGANQSIALQGRTFNEQEWEAIPVSCYTKLKDPCYGSNFKVLMNKLNRSVEVEKYDLVFNSQSEYRNYKQHIEWRNTNRHLISAKYIQNIKENGLCSSFHSASVFFERMPVRLYEIQDISLEEGLYIIYAAHQGFQKLYDKYGYFEIDPEMICFTREGFVKVWGNKNLSKAYPENVLIGNKNKTYEEFISKVLNVVEKLIDFEEHTTITEFINQRKIKNPFDKLLNVLELYIRDANITIPRYLSSIRNLCKRGKNNKTKDSRKVLNSSYVLSNKSSLSRTHEKSLEINTTLYNISINTPFRKSHEINQNDMTYRKRLSFIAPNHKIGNPYKSPHVSFQYSALPESPKNMSYSTEEDLFRKSKTYSTIDISGQRSKKMPEPLPKNSYFLSNDENFEIDPQIAADMLKIAENSL